MRTSLADRSKAAAIHRDVVLTSESTAENKAGGRMYVIGIGVDRYHAWGRLQNAAADARGALDAFVKLGFEQVHAPLLDDAATGNAIRYLVTDELRTLNANDSLVVFFAGHGHTVTTTFPDGTCTKKGYLIPVDAEPPGGRIGTWLSLNSWLSEISNLPPRHILVVLDACHSGVALDPVIRWRGADVRLNDSLEKLRARRSRRIITSALDDQLALDSGPLHGHSLFTGCLIEALTGGMTPRDGQSVVTGSEIGLHVQRRVTEYPESRQTPDFGALELDDRGELIIELPVVQHTSAPRRPTGPDAIWPKGSAGPDASAGKPGPVAEASPRSPIGPSTIKSKRASTETPQ